MSSCMLHIDHLCLSFTLSAISCASLLGRTGDMQVVSLQRFGCVSLGIIQHELLHALGFYHEHTRSDRDQYVKINWDNINQGKNSSVIYGSFDIFLSQLAINYSFYHQSLSTTSKSRTQIISTLRMTTLL